MLLSPALTLPLYKEKPMAVRSDSLSVLVVDEEPVILAFIARILDANGMRALLARSLPEAVGIAKRGYVPIDLVLADSDGKLSPAEIFEGIREIRPEVRALFMSAQLDSEIIRLQIMNRSIDDEGLIEMIRGAAQAPMVQRSGGASTR
jgi:response regulator RpfG family c-di-GMP phosphodiesterase